MKIIALLSLINLFFAPFLPAARVEESSSPASLLEEKAHILAQMQDMARRNSVDGQLHNDNQQLHKESSLFGNIWRGAVAGTVVVGLFIPAAIGAGISKLVVGKGSGMGHNIVSGLVGFSAALGALPTALLSVPVLPFGAGVGAAVGIKETIDERSETHLVVEKIWGHLQFIYNLLLVGEIDFMELSEQERITELTALDEQLREETKSSYGQLGINRFINYTQSTEHNLRAQIMTSILRSKAFQTSQGGYLSEDTIASFIEHLHQHKPDYVTEEHSKEAALLVIRFIRHYLTALRSSINSADAIEVLVEKL